MKELDNPLFFRRANDLADIGVASAYSRDSGHKGQGVRLSLDTPRRRATVSGMDSSAESPAAHQGEADQR